MTEKVERCNIEPAYASLQETDYDFPYKPPREFQVDALDWIHGDDTEPLALLWAATGMGKSAVFHQAIKEADGTVLLVYPTNALIRDQKEELKNELDDVSVEHITSGTLDNHGIDRARELKSYFRRIGTDVIITNPDILQAAVQGMYIDPSGSLAEIFEYCELVVFDEFHVYDEFSASGILLQIHIIINRLEQLGSANILLASATPDKSYFDMFEDLDIDNKIIKGDVVKEGSKFRCETDVVTYQDYISQCIRDVVTDVKMRSEDVELNKEEFEIAVICNNVKASNELYNTILEIYPELEEYTVKDNGYDTGHDYDKEGTILVTTSKAEVGLNHDIQYLFMDNPYNDPDSFVQRFGRAGRSSKAEVKVYGLGEVGLDDNMEYIDFLDVIYDALWEEHSDPDITENLIGLRAAYAAYNRSDLKKQTWRDLSTSHLFDRWYGFLQDFEEATNRYVRRDVRNIHKIVEGSLDTLKSLRGKTYSRDIEYQRGNERVTTEYSLLSAITQYGVKEVDDDTIILDGQYPEEEHAIQVEGVDKRFNLEKYSDINGIKKYMLSTLDENTNVDASSSKIQATENTDIDSVEQGESLNVEQIEEGMEISLHGDTVEVTKIRKEEGDTYIDCETDNNSNLEDMKIKPDIQKYMEIQKARNLVSIDKLSIKTQGKTVDIKPNEKQEKE